MTFPNTDGYSQPMHSEVQLLKKANHILKQLKEHKFHNELLLIKSQLISDKASLLYICTKESYYNIYDSDEKTKAQHRLKSTIELFEKLYKEITKE